MSAKRILVVDDSAFARRTLRQILERGGFEVEEATGGNEAMRYQLQKPDLVLLDVVMGEEGGIQVLKSLRQIDPGAAVLIATADIQMTTKEEAMRAGAAGLVNKPFKPEEVLSEVQRITSAPHG